MTTYSAYCNGIFCGEKSVVAYLIFKGGVFIEEKIIQVKDAEKSLSQQVLSIKLLIDRLIELNAEDATINFACKEAYSRIMKTYNKHIIKKEPTSIGFEKSNIYKIAENLKKFKSYKLNVISMRDNLRAQHASRKFIVEHWNNKTMHWKAEYPAN